MEEWDGSALPMRKSPVPQLLLAMRPAHGCLPAAHTVPAHGDPQRHVPLARAPPTAACPPQKHYLLTATPNNM